MNSASLSSQFFVSLSRLCRLRIMVGVVMGIMEIANVCAQRQVVYHDRIASLQVVAGTNWLEMPIAELGGDSIHVSFDEMSHDNHRYIYKVEHCEADWTVSQGVFGSDFVEGFNDDLLIEDNGQSMNTNRLYTHYSLTIPNEQCRIKMSGNYQLTVFDEDDKDEPVLKACFMIVEPCVKVMLQVSANTDMEVNKSHQQVSMQVDLGQLHVTHPQEQVKTVVVQNGRWDSAVLCPKPDFVTADKLQWLHVKSLIFPAGNVYRKFEMLDMNHATMGLDDVKWDGEDFHAFVQPALPRPSYVYDEAPHGAFYIRNSDNVENDVASDYAWVHFVLKAPRQEENVYLNADWTLDSCQPTYQMLYNDSLKCYVGTVLLKQGYYSYRYVVRHGDGSIEQLPTEGNFFQTKNTYQALVYFRGSHERTDRLVGYAKCSN